MPKALDVKYFLMSPLLQKRELNPLTNNSNDEGTGENNLMCVYF